MAAPRVLIENLPEQPVPEPADLLVVQNGAITKKMLVGALTTLTSAPIDEHITDDSGAHAASSISAQPNAAPMTGTDVQTQLSQIAAELIAVRESEHIEVGPVPPSDTEWLWADTNEQGADLDAPLPPPWFDVRDYGATGDGVTDDTAAIQAAINAASPNGQQVMIPPGVYKFSTLTIGGPIRLTGTGAMMRAGAPFGSPDWNDPSYMSGTILRSTATTGKAISTSDWMATIGLSIEDLLVIGPGSGTSIGLALGHADSGGSGVRIRLTRVGVGNFATGCWFGLENSHTNDLFVQGCLTGIQTSGTHNGNVHTALNVQVCTNFGLKLENSYGNVFNGGVFQSDTGTVIAVDGSANQFIGIYFENAGATNAIHIGYSGSVSPNNSIIGCLFTVAADKVLISGNYNIVMGHSDHAVTFAGAENFLLGTFPAFTDTSGGADSSIILNNKGPSRLGNEDVRMASGFTFYLESIGTSSFIRRSGTTAYTEIGAPAGYGVSVNLGGTERLKVTDAGVTIPNALDHDGTTAGFFGATPVGRQTGVPATAEGIHAALTALGLIAG